MLKGKFTVRCFGVGDGWPCQSRSHSSFLYRLGKTTLLVDAGESVSSRFKATRLPYDLIDQVFLSHLHADHCGGLLMLMQGFWLEQRRKKLTVNLPADGIPAFKQMFNAAYLYDEVIGFPLAFDALRATRPVTVGDAKVTPYRTTHLDRLRKDYRKKYPREYDAYCFLIEAHGLRIGHSADLGRPEDLAPLVRQPLDLLVCELAHFRAEDLFRYLSGRNIRRVIFTHVARPYWQDLKGTRLLAGKLLPRLPFAFARDDDEYAIEGAA
jgi:ribonuclease Z